MSYCTDQVYQRMLAFEAMLDHWNTYGVFVGGDVTALRAIHKDISAGRELPLNCSGCMKELLNDIFAVFDAERKHRKKLQAQLTKAPTSVSSSEGPAKPAPKKKK